MHGVHMVVMCLGYASLFVFSMTQTRGWSKVLIWVFGGLFFWMELSVIVNKYDIVLRQGGRAVTEHLEVTGIFVWALAVVTGVLP